MDRPARIRREFRWNGQRLADPDSSLTPEQVRDLYAQQWPELTTAAVQKDPVENGKEIVSFVKSQGPRAPAVPARTESYTFQSSQGARG